MLNIPLYFHQNVYIYTFNIVVNVKKYTHTCDREYLCRVNIDVKSHTFSFFLSLSHSLSDFPRPTNSLTFLRPFLPCYGAIYSLSFLCHYQVIICSCPTPLLFAFRCPFRFLLDPLHYPSLPLPFPFISQSPFSIFSPLHLFNLPSETPP